MSVLGIIEAMHAEIAPAYRLVWACLENHANGERWWPATEQQIADELHLSCDTVGRAVSWLTTQQIVQVERRKRRPSVFHMLRQYSKATPHFTPQKAESNRSEQKPKVQAEDHEMTPQPAETSNEATTPGFAPSTMESTPQNPGSNGQLTPQSADSLESTSKNPPEKTPPDSKRARARLSKGGPEFAEFYEAYPRKVAMDKAANAYAAAIGRGATHEGIMEALRRQRLGGFSAWNPTPKFRPHPASWLNGGQWKDQAPERDPEYDISKLTGYPAELARVARERAELAERERQSQPWLLEHAS